MLIFALGCAGAAPQISNADRVPASPKAGMSYRLVVSFGSECCGLDRSATAALTKVIDHYNYDALGYALGDWGKEGERDECFTLDGLSAGDKARFEAEVRANVKGKLVEIKTNATCTDRNRGD